MKRERKQKWKIKKKKKKKKERKDIAKHQLNATSYNLLQLSNCFLSKKKKPILQMETFHWLTISTNSIIKSFLFFLSKFRFVPDRWDPLFWERWWRHVRTWPRCAPSPAGKARASVVFHRCFLCCGRRRKKRLAWPVEKTQRLKVELAFGGFKLRFSRWTCKALLFSVFIL